MQHASPVGQVHAPPTSGDYITTQEAALRERERESSQEVESSEIESPFTCALSASIWRASATESHCACRGAGASFMALGSPLSLNCDAPLPRLFWLREPFLVCDQRSRRSGAASASRGLGSCCYYYYYYYYSCYYFLFPFSRAPLLRLNFVVVSPLLLLALRFLRSFVVLFFSQPAA